MIFYSIAESISFSYVVIMIIYAWDKSVMRSLKGRIFNLCLTLVLACLTLNVITTSVFHYRQIYPQWLLAALVWLCYILTPLLSLIFLYYVITIIRNELPGLLRRFWPLAIPYLVFILATLYNFQTTVLYSISVSAGLVRGPGFHFVFLLVFLHNLFIVIYVLSNHQSVDAGLMWALLALPFISTIYTVIQILAPSVLIMGSASAISLMIISFYFQNKKTYLDNLTSVQNREAFFYCLNRAVRHQSEPTILLVSLDDFRIFNDLHGQEMGDKILRLVSTYLMTEVPKHYLYRYSGDEFAIIFDSESRLIPGRIAEFISGRFHQPWLIGQQPFTLQASLAVTRVPLHAQVQDVISLLEFCIDQSKQNGKGQIITATAELVSKSQRRNQILSLIRRELDRHGFEVYYQPIYHLTSGSFISAEALLRLYDPDLGYVSPAEFIPIAEKSGLIIEIGYLVLAKVCQYIRQLDAAGAIYEGISVNLSVLQLHDKNLIDKIMATIHHFQVNPQKIQIEVTESAFINQHANIESLIHKLRAYGIRFYLDDFGTGYSNLASVIRLDFDCIKLDKSILDYSTSSEKYRGLLGGMIRTFTELGTRVVVEGVEHENQRQIIESLQARYAQGFLFARPAPGEQILPLFAVASQAETEFVSDPDADMPPAVPAASVMPADLIQDTPPAEMAAFTFTINPA